MRYLTLSIDPNRPLHMHDGEGRTVRYLGMLQMMVFGRPHRVPALEPDDEEWIAWL